MRDKGRTLLQKEAARDLQIVSRCAQGLVLPTRHQGDFPRHEAKPIIDEEITVVPNNADGAVNQAVARLGDALEGQRPFLPAWTHSPLHLPEPRLRPRRVEVTEAKRVSDRLRYEMDVPPGEKADEDGRGDRPSSEHPSIPEPLQQQTDENRLKSEPRDEKAPHRHPVATDHDRVSRKRDEDILNLVEIGE